MIARRTVLAGGAVLASAAALRPWGAIAATGDLRAALDAARAEHDPKAALRLLAPFAVAGLAPAAQLDLLTARAGLAVDVALVERGVDPRGKNVATRDPAILTLLLRRKLGDGIALGTIAARFEHERVRCEQQATALFDRIGVTGPDTGARFSQLWQDAAERYPDSDVGRDAAIAEMNRWLARFRGYVPDLVGEVPPYCLDVAAIRPSAADLASGHVGARTLPTPGHAGGYVVDLTHVQDRPRWTLPSVVAHELLPGHMLQMPLEAAADPHPLRLDYAPAFAEGWGIYAERLMARCQVYAADPRAALGQLHWRTFRIGRALVDLAIHVEGLSIDAARARLVAWQGEPVAFAPFDSDLARIANEPMTRVAEMCAALSIEDNTGARSGAGLRRYHRLVLDAGRMRSDELDRRTRSLA